MTAQQVAESKFKSLAHEDMDRVLSRWERADNYAGKTYYEYYGLIGAHRDSGLIDQSNFDTALERLREVGDEITEGREYLNSNSKWVTVQDSPGDFVVATANHWAVGWVSSILIHEDCNEDVAEEAVRIKAELEDYPVLDEDDWMRRESEEIQELWERAPIHERLDWIGEANERVWYGEQPTSIFAARHDDNIPDGVWTYLSEYYIDS